MRIAMIGAGGIARVHLSALSQDPALEIVAHVSASEERARANAAVFGGRAFPDLSSLLDAFRVEAAWVCVPPYAHGEVEDALIRRRIPFFVEKPLAADAETPERIARALDDTGLVTAAGYHWRAMDTVQEVRARLREQPPALLHGLWFDAGPPPPWWYRRATGGGQMLEQTTHLIDLARFLVGEASVVSVTSAPAPPDHERAPDFPGAATAVLRFAGGIPAVFSATWLLAMRAAVHLQIVCNGLLMTIGRSEVTYDEPAGRRSMPLRMDPFAAEDRTFVEAVRRGDPSFPFSPYADAVRTHRLCWEITTRLSG